MTREEAIHILDNLKPTNTKSSFDAYVVGKAITMAIKALEQEDITWIVGNDNVQIAVRNMPVDMMQKINAIIGNLQEPTTKNDLEVEQIIDELEKEFEKVNMPIMDNLTLFAKTQNALYRCAELNNLEYLNNSVTPQEPKTGHWIAVHPLQPNDEGDYMCSVCRCGGLTYKPTKFCPNCGVKMVEPQESEDKKV